jgi:putative heme iron utilization protein
MQIAQINAQAQLMQQRAQQFLMEDPDGQASQIADAQMQLQQQIPGEAEIVEEEQALEEPVE